jgi:uncharacterized protein YjbJ (UPF0337 family)
VADQNKARGKAQEVKGKAKEVAGEDFGKPGLARKGRAEQRKGAARGAFEKVKDAFSRKRYGPDR